MEPEPESIAPSVALPESAMTIDYDADPASSIVAPPEGGGGDEEMGEQEDPDAAAPPAAPPPAPAEVEEAEMADDEASAWEKDAMVDEQEVGVAAEPTEATLVAQDAETLPEVTPTATVTEVTVPTAPGAEQVALALDSDLASDAALLPSAPSEVAPPGPAPVGQLPSTTTNGASHATEQSLVTAEVPLSEGEQADVEQSDFPEPLKSATAAAASLHGEGDTQFDDSAPSSPFLRPQIDKALLLGIEVPAPDETSTSNPLAPAVLFTYDNTMYSLFRPHKPVPHSNDSEDEGGGGGSRTGGEDEEEPRPLLAGADDQSLYYGTLEQVFSKLHDQFPELSTREDELVLDFDEIGIALTEDNIYSRQVSLHDFDRIHLGCGLPGRLHARLYAQSRFSSGFNALAQHVANTLNGDGNGTGEGDDSEATYDAEDGTVNGDDEYLEESFVTVGEPEDQDADGPDSELPVVGHEQDGETTQSGTDEARGEGEDVTGEGEGEGDEEFDLESALAQLDGDDVAAYVEGAAEDYILSEGKQDDQDHEAQDDQDHEVQGDEQAGQAEVGGAEPPSAGLEGDAPVEEAGEGVSLAASEMVQREAVEGGLVEVDQAGSAETPSQPQQTIENSGVDADSSSIVDHEPNPSIAAPALDHVDEVKNVEGNSAPEAAPSSSDVVDDATVPTTEVPDSNAASDGAVQYHESSDANGETHDTELGANGIEKLNETETTAVKAIGPDPVTAEDAVDPNDVVIDYDEAFDGSSLAPPSTEGPEGSEIVDLQAVPAEEPETAAAPHSPKRRHDSLDTDEAGEIAQVATDGSDAKRPRLEDATSTTENA
ncbi:hypothetical protein JCM11491_002842 [Sporobolomyces phaffii]